MTTQEHPQAALLRALAEHVTSFPGLPAVNIISSRALQILGDLGGVGPASAVLQWAKTLTEVRILIHRTESSSGEWTKVAAKGTIDGIPVTVWDADRNDLYKWVESGVYEQPLPLERLAAYVAAGTVDGVES